MIKTSVIIPVYNTEKYLCECLESVLNQSQKELEIIAVDDGSTDCSLDILHRYKKLYSNIQVYSQENKRQGVARNNGLQHAKGEYIYFLDSDDTIDPETLEDCYKYAKEKNLDIVLFDSKVIIEGELPDGFQPDSFDRRKIVTEHKKIYTGIEFLERYMEYQPDTVSPCMMYISADFIKKYNFSFMPKVFYEDEEFRFNLMQKGKRVLYVPQLYYNRRYRISSTMTVQYDVNRNRDLTKVIEQMIKDVDDENSSILKRYIEIKLWMLLDRCRLAADINGRDELVGEIINVVHQYWKTFDMPQSIEDIKFRVYYINYLQSIFQNIDCSKEVEETEKQRMLLLKKVPLGDYDKKIGIYGREDLIDRLFWGYKNNCGEIKANIYWLVEKKSKDNKEIEISSSDIRDLDCILLISGLKQKDIYSQLLAGVGKRIRVIILGDEEGNFLF